MDLLYTTLKASEGIEIVVKDKNVANYKTGRDYRTGRCTSPPVSDTTGIVIILYLWKLQIPNS